LFEQRPGATLVTHANVGEGEFLENVRVVHAGTTWQRAFEGSRGLSEATEFKQRPAETR
jgi:hypothetical protein